MVVEADFLEAVVCRWYAGAVVCRRRQQALLGCLDSTLLLASPWLVSLSIGRLSAVDEVEDFLPTAHVAQRLRLFLEAVHSACIVLRHRLLERGPLRLQTVAAWPVISEDLCRHPAGSMFPRGCQACPITST